MLNRRSFLKSLGTGALAGLVPASAQSSTTSHEADPDSWGVLVDVTYCIGCRKCEWACQQSNELGTAPMSDFENAIEIDDKRRPDTGNHTVVNGYEGCGLVEDACFVKVQCMHCLDPACVSACIVGALEKEAMGPVRYVASECIGCRYCMVACPFQIPTYEYDEALAPVVQKCTFCYEQSLLQGGRPACVDICPEGALRFGKRSELLSYAKGRIEKHPDRYHPEVYGEHTVGGTAWLYIASRPMTELGLPDLPEQAPPRLTESVQHGIFKNWVPPLALYAFLGGAMWMNRDGGEDNE
jgi:formate dehydrogenase iron-sulfur subunit